MLMREIGFKANRRYKSLERNMKMLVLIEVERNERRLSLPLEDRTPPALTMVINHLMEIFESCSWIQTRILVSCWKRMIVVYVISCKTY